MSMNTIIGAIALVILAVAGYLFLRTDAPADEPKPSDLGTYHYECEDFTFAMMPGNDMTTITLVPAPGAPFFRAVLTQSGESGRRFEGGGVTLTGAGEAVTINAADGTFSCRPLPSSEYAPWNWGDPDEGDGTRRDLALIVSENIVGKWQNADDATFVREFMADGAFFDMHGDDDRSGLWQTFSRETPLPVSFTLDENSAYLRMVANETETFYRVVSVTPETLEMNTADGASVLRFTRIVESAGQ